MSEADNTWRVTLDGTDHEVEPDHGTISGSRAIKLDGEVIEKDRKIFDTATTHNFEIAGHPAPLWRDSHNGVPAPGTVPSCRRSAPAACCGRSCWASASR